MPTKGPRLIGVKQLKRTKPTILTGNTEHNMVSGNKVIRLVAAMLVLELVLATPAMARKHDELIRAFEQGMGTVMGACPETCMFFPWCTVTAIWGCHCVKGACVR